MAAYNGATPASILNLQDKVKEIGTLLSFADYLVRQGIASAKKDCSSINEKKEGLIKLIQAAELYFALAEIPNADKDPNYEKIISSLDESLYFANRVKIDLAACTMKAKYPGLDKAVALSNAASSGAPSEEAEARRKILGTQIDNPCGFRSFNDYAGGTRFVEFFNKVAIYPFLYKNISIEQGDKIEGILLAGPPGTGKTLLAEAVAEKLQEKGAKFFSVNPGTIKGKYVGESEKNFKILFEEARRATNGGQNPVVLFLDEVDGILDETNTGSGLGTSLIGEFASQFEGLANKNDPLNSNKGLIVIAATNYPEKIAASALSRLKHKIYVGLPTLNDIREMIITKLEKMGDARHNFNVDRFATMVNGEAVWKIRREHINYVFDAATYQNPTDDPRKDDIDTMCYYLFDANIEYFEGFDDILDSNGRVIGSNPRYRGNRYPKPYAPREIDAIFSWMRLGAAFRSVRFLLDYEPSGNNRQLWIVDRSSYEVKEETASKTKCKVEIKHKHAFIPIGPWRGNPESSQSVGSIYDARKLREGKQMLKSNPAKNIKMYVSERRQTPANTWEFQIIGQEDEKNPGNIVMGKIEGLDQISNIPTLLGISQITMDDFMNAIDAIKPIEIKNAQKLYDWASESAISFKGGEDLERLRELAVRRNSVKSKTPQNDDILTSVLSLMEKIKNGQREKELETM